MSGPYEQQMHNQAPGFYPGPVPGQAPGGFFPGPVHGGPMNQPTSAYVTTDGTHGEHVKQSGSTSSSGSYVADHHHGGHHMGYGAGPMHTVSHHGGFIGGPMHTMSYHGGYGGPPFDSGVCGPRRHGRFRRQVIRVPETIPGCVRQVRHRLLTPEPDTLDRVYIQRQGGDIVEEITEVPTTPPPRVQERTVVEPSGPPQVIRKVIRVPPRGGGYGPYHGDIGISHVPPPVSNVVNTGSYAPGGGFPHYGNIQISGTITAMPVGGPANCVPAAPQPNIAYCAPPPQPSVAYCAPPPQPSLAYCAPPPQPSLAYCAPPQQPSLPYCAPPQQPNFNYCAPPQQPNFNYCAPPQQPNFNFCAPPQQPNFNYCAPPQQAGFGFGGFQSQALLPGAQGLPANCFFV